MLFTKGAESAILPFSTTGEIEKTRLHVDEFALVRHSQGCITSVAETDTFLGIKTDASTLTYFVKMDRLRHRNL